MKPTLFFLYSQLGTIYCHPILFIENFSKSNNPESTIIKILFLDSNILSRRIFGKDLDGLVFNISKKINLENIILIDNSHLHTKHKSFDSNKLHLKIIIKSEKLKNMNKIEAHKKIYSILKEEMNNKIHALEIEIH